MTRTPIKGQLGAASYQEKLRQEALQRQKAARKEHADVFRLAASAVVDAQEEDAAYDAEIAEAGVASSMARLRGIASGSSQHAGPRLIDGQHPRQFYSHQFMHPEWMTDIPPDLAINWTVRARPEGRRSLVVSFRGRTVSRQRTGAVLHTFPSPLPEGSEDHQSGSNQFCILDCVFSEADATYWVLDVLCWRGCALYECTAEFRMFWLQSRLQEEGVLGLAGSAEHKYRFMLAEVYPCSMEGLDSAYRNPTPYPKDGLLLLHQQGHYIQGGTSPLALLWKDQHCSPYWIDTDAHGVVAEHQQVTLWWGKDGSLLTSDNPPVVVGHLPETTLMAALQAKAGKVRLGQLLRLSIQQGGLQLQGGIPIAADLRFKGLGNQRKGRADSWSKILFQYMARRSPLRFERLMEAAELSAETIEEDVLTESLQVADEAMAGGG